MIDIIIKILGSLFDVKRRKKKILKVKPIYQVNSPIPEIEKFGCNLATMAMISNYMKGAENSLDDYYLGYIESKAMTKKCYINSYVKCLKEFGVKAKYKMNVSKTSIHLQSLISENHPVKCRMKTGKSSYHFSLIVGWKETKDGLIFTVNDPMKRDKYANEKLEFMDSKKVKTGRKIDRLDYVV